MVPLTASHAAKNIPAIYSYHCFASQIPAAGESVDANMQLNAAIMLLL